MQLASETIWGSGHLVCTQRLCITVTAGRCTDIRTRPQLWHSDMPKRRATRRGCVGQAPSVRPHRPPPTLLSGTCFAPAPVVPDMPLRSLRAAVE
eukprot:3424704-Prymnesium_polylepis.1